VSRISSRYTQFLKWAFPAFWFGGLALLMLDQGVFMVPALMMGAGWVFFKSFLWDVADDVRDEGEALRVRFRGEEETIAFADVLDVSLTRFTSPQRISLRLARPGRFGEQIVFIPNGNRLGSGLVGGNAIAGMLAGKVARARSNRA
jgi:hypothetical protein